jgi:hypothetical protein
MFIALTVLSRPHDGMNISYTHFVDAASSVYNISRPMAHLLAIVGYVTCGKLSFSSVAAPQDKQPSLANSLLSSIPISWTLDLASLSQHGTFKIAHTGSLVHPNTPSHAPDPALVAEVLERATPSGGLSLQDLAHIHAARVAELKRPLSSYHTQIAQGESGLFWSVMRRALDRGYDDIIPIERVRHWLCEERLPHNWWSSVRPSHTVTLAEARSNANAVQKLMTDA